MAFVISVQQEKGGVAKTTTSTNLSAALARAGQKTLLIDFDPGAADSALVGAELPHRRASLDKLLKARSLGGAILPTRTPGLSIIPGDRTAKPQNFQDEDLVQLVLAEALESVHDSFEFIVVDVKGGLDLMGQMAMYASDLVVIPCDRDRETVEKAQLTYKYALGVAKKRERVGRPVPDDRFFAKYLLSKWNPRRKASTELERGLTGLPESAIFSTRVYSCEDVQRGRNAGLTVFEFAERLLKYQRSRSLIRAVEQFEQLAEEVTDHAGTFRTGARCANA